MIAIHTGMNHLQVLSLFDITEVFSYIKMAKSQVKFLVFKKLICMDFLRVLV